MRFFYLLATSQPVVSLMFAMALWPFSQLLALNVCLAKEQAKSNGGN